MTTLTAIYWPSRQSTNKKAHLLVPRRWANYRFFASFAKKTVKKRSLCSHCINDCKGSWSGLRDLNPRSLEPKSSAIPNFAKPGYSVKDFSDVVKHVVKSHFRPQFLRSQGRKVLEPQRFFGLRIFPGTSGRSAPKPGALPTGPHPEI